MNDLTIAFPGINGCQLIDEYRTEKDSLITLHVLPGLDETLLIIFGNPHGFPWLTARRGAVWYTETTLTPSNLAQACSVSMHLVEGPFRPAEWARYDAWRAGATMLGAPDVTDLVRGAFA